MQRKLLLLPILLFLFPEAKAQSSLSVDYIIQESASESKPGFLETENLKLLGVVRERKEAQSKSRTYRESIRESSGDFVYFTQGKNLSDLQLPPNGKFATFSLFTTLLKEKP